MTDRAASGTGADFAAEVTQEVAAAWIARWDAQQTRYIADREERFAVIGDVVTRAVGDSLAPVVLDIGCGPGSLAGRLAHRLPHAVLLGVDVDPLLLALGRTRYGATEPARARLQARRAERGLSHGYGNRLSVDQHVAMLQAAGFTTIGPVWQSGTDHVLVARVGTG